MDFANSALSILLSIIMFVASSASSVFSASPAGASDIATKLHVLSELGIEFSEETALYIEQTIDETNTMLAEVGFDVSQFSSYPIVLSMLGMGKYDETTEQFIPLTNDVHAFDAECIDIVEAYGDFLLAISQISGEEILIGDCSSEVSEGTFQTGIGTQQVTFSLNGKPYAFEAQFYYDWMDCTIIDYVNTILDEQGNNKRLWCMFDGGQGFVVFYNTADWAEAFSKQTGCPLALKAADAV